MTVTIPRAVYNKGLGGWDETAFHGAKDVDGFSEESTPRSGFPRQCKQIKRAVGPDEDEEEDFEEGDTEEDTADIGLEDAEDAGPEVEGGLGGAVIEGTEEAEEGQFTVNGKF